MQLGSKGTIGAVRKEQECLYENFVISVTQKGFPTNTLELGLGQC